MTRALLNFATDTTPEILAGLADKGFLIDRVLDVQPVVRADIPLQDQVGDILAGVPISFVQWLDWDFYLIPPVSGTLSALVLVEMHRRMKRFPRLVLVRFPNITQVIHL